jgi:hypothetical protein
MSDIQPPRILTLPISHHPVTSINQNLTQNHHLNNFSQFVSIQNQNAHNLLNTNMQNLNNINLNFEENVSTHNNNNNNNTINGATGASMNPNQDFSFNNNLSYNNNNNNSRMVNANAIQINGQDCNKLNTNLNSENVGFIPVHPNYPTLSER